MCLVENPDLVGDFTKPSKIISIALIECHYFNHGSWLTGDKALLNKKNIDRIRHIPTKIVHGRYDVICSYRQAYDLYQAFPEAKMITCPSAGHSAHDPQIERALVQCMDEFKRL